MTHPATITYLAAAARDAVGTNHRPAAVRVRDGRIVAVHQDAAPADSSVIRLPNVLILPALVNAHAHLDLTLLGPQPYAGDFLAWLRAIVQRRPVAPPDIEAAVRRGLELARAAGVGYVGDIAGSGAAAQARWAASEKLALDGVSYLECFGSGRRQLAGFIDLTQRLERLPKLRPGAVGIQPHAPYSAGLALYHAVGRFAAERGYRCCTHLAESPAEVEFVRHAAGPFAALLKQLGKWDETFQPTGLHPIDWLEPELRRGGWLAAHGNYVGDAHLHTLTYCRTSVAYCPLASEYFGFPHDGPHRYREMLAAGVNVCLGTDSILCQPAVEPQPLGILPQMRRLFRRDGADPATLLCMATVNGLRALGLKETLATLQPGAPARLIGVEIDPRDPTDPLAQALRNDHPVRIVAWNNPMGA